MPAPARPLGNRFREALVWAAEQHADQVKKGGDVPYVSHLLGVTALVLEFGGDEDQAIGALLHDALEDVGAHLREPIRRRFGERVLAIVEGCSDTDRRPKPPWCGRKRTYIEHLATASEDVLLVSMADKLHNARSLLADHRQVGAALWARFSGGRKGTLWYYRELVEAFAARGGSPLLDELRLAVDELLARAAGEPA
jgi:GTP pyrophosphokinase